MPITKKKKKETKEYIKEAAKTTVIKKKNKIMPFAATWMELETLILNEVSQKEKDKYRMISLISGIKCMAQMNLSTDKKIMDLENRLLSAKGGGGGSGVVGELGVNRYKLLPLEWIINEILLCRAGNYVWPLMREHDNMRK